MRKSVNSPLNLYYEGIRGQSSKPGSAVYYLFYLRSGEIDEHPDTALSLGVGHLCLKTAFV